MPDWLRLLPALQALHWYWYRTLSPGDYTRLPETLRAVAPRLKIFVFIPSSDDVNDMSLGCIPKAISYMVQLTTLDTMYSFLSFPEVITNLPKSLVHLRLRRMHSSRPPGEYLNRIRPEAYQQYLILRSLPLIKTFLGIYQYGLMHEEQRGEVQQEFSSDEVTLLRRVLLEEGIEDLTPPIDIHWQSKLASSVQDIRLPRLCSTRDILM